MDNPQGFGTSSPLGSGKKLNRCMSALAPKSSFFFDPTISLDELARRMKDYDRMPIAVQTALRKSVAITLASNVVSIPLLWLATYNLSSTYPVQSFFFVITGGLIDFLLRLADGVSAYLLALNIISLLLVGTVLAVSRAFTRPVREHYHWMAWLAAIPTGLSIVSAAIITGLVILVVLLTLIIWIVITIILLVFITLAAKASEEASKKS
jgi:hypothetical protein